MCKTAVLMLSPTGAKCCCGDEPVVGSLQSWKSSVLLFYPSESSVAAGSTVLLNVKEDI